MISFGLLFFFFFFSHVANSLPAYIATFSASFFSFFRTVTFSQQLFFQNSFFFRAKLLQSSHFFSIGSSLWQLLFGTAIFFLFFYLFFFEEMFRLNISEKELLFQRAYFCTASTFSDNLHYGKSYLL